MSQQTNSLSQAKKELYALVSAAKMYLKQCRCNKHKALVIKTIKTKSRRLLILKEFLNGTHLLNTKVYKTCVDSSVKPGCTFARTES